MARITARNVTIGIDTGKGEFEPIGEIKMIDDLATPSFFGEGSLTISGTIQFTPMSNLSMVAFCAALGYPAPTNTERETAEHLLKVLQRKTPEG